MKHIKKILFFAPLLLFLLTACTDGSAPEEDPLKTKLERSAAASKVACAVTLFSGEHLLAESVSVYQVTESGAELAHTLKTLSDDILAEELYETVTTTASVSESDFLEAAALPFDAAKAEERAEGDTVYLQTDDPAGFFGSETAAAFTDVQAAIRLLNERPVSCDLAFTLPNGHSVTIVYTFSY